MLQWCQPSPTLVLTSTLLDLIADITSCSLTKDPCYERLLIPRFIHSHLRQLTNTFHTVFWDSPVGTSPNYLLAWDVPFSYFPFNPCLTPPLYCQWFLGSSSKCIICPEGLLQGRAKWLCTLHFHMWVWTGTVCICSLSYLMGRLISQPDKPRVRKLLKTDHSSEKKV